MKETEVLEKSIEMIDDGTINQDNLDMQRFRQKTQNEDLTYNDANCILGHFVLKYFPTMENIFYDSAATRFGFTIKQAKRYFGFDGESVYFTKYGNRYTLVEIREELESFLNELK